MRNPYVGITGFMSRAEVDAVLSEFPKTAARALMVGVLVSSKTLRGVPNKWPNRFPAVGNVAGIFPSHPQALNLIHYSTDDKASLHDQLVELVQLGGANLHGFQLNIAWPMPGAVRHFREAFPHLKLVLQVGWHAFEMVHHSPKLLAERVLYYGDSIDYVLLDPSGGLGKPLDVSKARGYLTALVTQMGFAQLAVAGGLGPDTLSLVEPLVKEFSELSIDAEGRLRDADDHLLLEACHVYVAKALGIFANRVTH
ncbi:hypothetical protein A3A70_00405 [candidate division WWE3 bacterium RIFCSPLOWO2_01_FULL_42_11]|uniref:Amidohydrolase-related domain-containing protein n=1 Tax=candidate division WWE3 bacterium RIFCSPLOWO2_01_FULL_42_11 TaxID=1802627 RepID=A0A1F4VLT3_UNCKA|nr:MAG: hypothetical protein A3A70_00405 [candidate division WWE3 bacterium RIFCSPLOWO2_01_FULL_42_11]